MSTFVFNSFKERFMKGEVPSADTWVMRPVNSKFKEYFDNDDMKLEQYRTSADFQLMGDSMGSAFSDTIEKVYPITHTYKKASSSDTITDEDKPVFVTEDNWQAFSKVYAKSIAGITYTSDGATSQNLYDMFFNSTGLFYQWTQYGGGGFYWVTTVDQLHWCANRVNGDMSGTEKTDEFNNRIVIVLGDDIGEHSSQGNNATETVIDFSIGKYADRPFEGLLFGFNYAFRNIELHVTTEAAGVVGYLGYNGMISNVNWYGDTTVVCDKKINLTHIKNSAEDVCCGLLCGVNYGAIRYCYVGKSGIENKANNSITLKNFIPAVYLVQNKSEEISELIGDSTENFFYPNYMCLNSPGNIVPYVGYFNEGVFGTTETNTVKYWTSNDFDRTNYDYTGIAEVSAAGYSANYKFYDFNIVQKVFEAQGRDIKTINQYILYHCNPDPVIMNRPTRLHQFNRAAYYVSPICGNNKGYIFSNQVDCDLKTEGTFVGFIGGICGKYSGKWINANKVNLRVQDSTTRDRFIVPNFTSADVGKKSYLKTNWPEWWSPKYDYRNGATKYTEDDLKEEFEIVPFTDDSACLTEDLNMVNYHGTMMRMVNIPQATVTKEYWWYSSATSGEILSDIQNGKCEHGTVGSIDSPNGASVKNTYYNISAIDVDNGIPSAYDAYMPLYPRSTTTYRINEDATQKSASEGYRSGNLGTHVGGTFDTYEDYVYNPYNGCYTVPGPAADFDISSDYESEVYPPAGWESVNILFYKADSSAYCARHSRNGLKLIDANSAEVFSMYMPSNYDIGDLDSEECTEFRNLFHVYTRPYLRIQKLDYKMLTSLQENVIGTGELATRYYGAPVQINTASGITIDGIAKTCFSGTVHEVEGEEIKISMKFDVQKLYIDSLDNSNSSGKKFFVETASASYFNNVTGKAPTNFIYASVPESTPYINHELKSIHCVGGLIGNFIYGPGSVTDSFATNSLSDNEVSIENNISYFVPYGYDASGVYTEDWARAYSKDYAAYDRVGAFAAVCELNSSMFSDLEEPNTEDGYTVNDKFRQILIYNNKFKYKEGIDTLLHDDDRDVDVATKKMSTSNIIDSEGLKFGICSPLIPETRPTYLSVPSVNSYITDSPVFQNDFSTSDFYTTGKKVGSEDHKIRMRDGNNTAFSRLYVMPSQPTCDSGNPNCWSFDMNIDMPLKDMFVKYTTMSYDSWLPMDVNKIPSKIFGFKDNSNKVMYTEYGTTTTPMYGMRTPIAANTNAISTDGAYAGSKKIALYQYRGSNLYLKRYDTSMVDANPDDFNGMYMNWLQTADSDADKPEYGSDESWIPSLNAPTERTGTSGRDIFKYSYTSSPVEPNNSWTALDCMKLPVTFEASEYDALGYWYKDVIDDKFNLLKSVSIKGGGFDYDGAMFHLGMKKYPTVIREEIIASGYSLTSSISANDFQGLYVTDSSGNNVMYIDTEMGEVNGLTTWQMGLKSFDPTDPSNNKGLLLEVK